MMGDSKDESSTRAWVVFSGKADMAWLKILRPGFRHCYILLNDGSHWVSLDPLSSYTDIHVHHVPAAFNFPLWLKDRGHDVIPAPLKRKPKEAPWSLFTCVEAVKRVLGIHNRFIITPWQLYCHLVKQHQSEKGDFVWEV